MRSFYLSWEICPAPSGNYDVAQTPSGESAGAIVQGLLGKLQTSSAKSGLMGVVGTFPLSWSHYVQQAGISCCTLTGARTRPERPGRPRPRACLGRRPNVLELIPSRRQNSSAFKPLSACRASDNARNSGVCHPDAWRLVTASNVTIMLLMLVTTIESQIFRLRGRRHSSDGHNTSSAPVAAFITMPWWPPSD